MFSVNMNHITISQNPVGHKLSIFFYMWTLKIMKGANIHIKTAETSGYSGFIHIKVITYCK